MRRVLMAVTVAVLVAGGSWARPTGHDDSYFAGEAEKIVEEQRTTEIGALTFADLEGWQGRLSAAAAKDRYVAKSAGMSLALPGLGQLANKQTGSGLLFLGGDLAIGVGAILGAYFLLPADLRFDQLDYLRTPFSTIEATWKSHTLLEYLPAIGVSIGGHLLDMVLRGISAHNARYVARQRIEAGLVPGEGK